MTTLLLDADSFQVARWDVPLPWVPDDDLPPSSDFDIEPDWDAAFEPTDADWDEMARWSEWLDMKERESLYTEDDARAAGLAIG